MLNEKYMKCLLQLIHNLKEAKRLDYNKNCPIKKLNNGKGKKRENQFSQIRY